MIRITVAALTLAMTASLALAQSQPPASSPPASSPPASAPPAAGAPSTPKVDCKAQAQGKNLRGQEMRDEVAICVEEQRLACLKEAVSKKIGGAQRRQFVRECAGRPDKKA